jgi:hypothetical protein
MEYFFAAEIQNISRKVIQKNIAEILGKIDINADLFARSNRYKLIQF